MSFRSTLIAADGPVSTAERVFQALERAIVHAELRPGQALSEAETAKRFAVSRQPVREAFIRLAEAGLVAIRPYRGTFVRKIAPEEVAEGRFVREAIEVAIVRDLALQGAELSALEASLAAQARVQPGDNDGFMALDEHFHRTLAELAGHLGAWRVVERAKAQMNRVRWLSLDHATPTARLVTQHAAIVDAVRAADPDAAERAMRTHLGELATALPKLQAVHPDLFEARAATDDPPPTDVVAVAPAAQTTQAGEKHP